MRPSLAVLLLALLLAGCGEPVSRDNYARVETDMAETAVFDLLGEPDRSRSVTIGGVSGTHHSWEGDGFVISIQFLNGKVVSTQMAPSG